MLKVFTVLVWSWLIPGAGYWLLKKRAKAILLFVLLTSVYVAGMVMQEFHFPAIREHPYNFALQLLIALHTAIFYVVSWGNDSFVLVKPVYAELGLLYVWVACLMNLLTIFHVYALAISIYIPPQEIPKQQDSQNSQKTSDEESVLQEDLNEMPEENPESETLGSASESISVSLEGNLEPINKIPEENHKPMNEMSEEHPGSETFKNTQEDIVLPKPTEDEKI